MLEDLRVIVNDTDADGVIYLEIALKFKMRSTPFYISLNSDYTLKEVIQEFVRLISTLIANSEIGEL